MSERPSSAFAFSLLGGIITLISALLLIHSWLFMYGISGTTFSYTMLVDLLNFTAIEALVIFVVDVACGVLIIFGAVLQRSGLKSRVRAGSITLLIATIVAAPSTTFGFLIGGILSTYGGYLGLTWTGKGLATSPKQQANVFP